MDTEKILSDLLAATLKNNELLSGILDALNQPKLGLGDPPSGIIYANRRNGCLWYTIKDGEPQPIAAAALTGYLTELKFDKVERRGKEVVKLQAHVKADRPYIIESGHDSNFAKGLLMAIATLIPPQLRQPITISPQAGNEESVLFCRVFIGSELIHASYNDETNWRVISQKALAVVRAAN